MNIASLLKPASQYIQNNFPDVLRYGKNALESANVVGGRLAGAGANLLAGKGRIYGPLGVDTRSASTFREAFDKLFPYYRNGAVLTGVDRGHLSQYVKDEGLNFLNSSSVTKRSFLGAGGAKNSMPWFDESALRNMKKPVTLSNSKSIVAFDENVASFNRTAGPAEDRMWSANPNTFKDPFNVEDTVKQHLKSHLKDPKMAHKIDELSVIHGKNGNFSLGSRMDDVRKFGLNTSVANRIIGATAITSGLVGMGSMGNVAPPPTFYHDGVNLRRQGDMGADASYARAIMGGNSGI